MSGYSGKGSGIGHAGELLQGALLHDQRQEPFLVTLPAPPFVSRAAISYSHECEDHVEPVWRTKALQAARIAVTEIGGRNGPLRLIIDSQTPVGRGCGSSTSDCVAAIRAVSNLLEYACSADEIAQWTAQAEVASDSTMFNLRPVAFQQRHGRILRLLGQAFPPARVIVADLGGPPVDTVVRPVPQYTSTEVAAFQELLALLELSIQKQDARAVAQVASESAAIHQRYYPHPRWQEFVTATRRADALGAACAHSGSLGVALFSPGENHREERLLDALTHLSVPVLARYTLESGLEGEEIACLSS